MNEELKQDGTKRPHEAFTEATGSAARELGELSEEDVFDTWLHSERPSGDVTEVNAQWEDSYERRAWIEAVEQMHNKPELSDGQHKTNPTN